MTHSGPLKLAGR